MRWEFCEIARVCFFRLYRIFKFENKMKSFLSLGEEDDLP